MVKTHCTFTFTFISKTPRSPAAVCWLEKLKYKKRQMKQTSTTHPTSLNFELWTQLPKTSSKCFSAFNNTLHWYFITNLNVTKKFAINLELVFLQSCLVLSCLPWFYPPKLQIQTDFDSIQTMNHLFELPEQICYVQCGICTTILLVSWCSSIQVNDPLCSFGLYFRLDMQVSVPCSSLSMAVTVTCGHCSSLLSVNMKKATLVPLHFLSSLARNAVKPLKMIEN